MFTAKSGNACVRLIVQTPPVQDGSFAGIAKAMVLAPLAFAAWIAPRSEHPAVALAHALATTVSDVFLTVYRKVICAFAGRAKAPNPISAMSNIRNPRRLAKESPARPDGTISPWNR